MGLSSPPLSTELTAPKRNFVSSSSSFIILVLCCGVCRGRMRVRVREEEEKAVERYTGLKKGKEDGI